MIFSCLYRFLVDNNRVVKTRRRMRLKPKRMWVRPSHVAKVPALGKRTFRSGIFWRLRWLDIQNLIHTTWASWEFLFKFKWAAKWLWLRVSVRKFTRFKWLIFEYEIPLKRARGIFVSKLCLAISAILTRIRAKLYKHKRLSIQFVFYI